MSTEFRINGLSIERPVSSTKLALFSGYLGAGKTTAIATLAKALMGAGERVAVITNDQGSRLVDTAFLKTMGIATSEVAGGCFCCRFTDLEAAIAKVIEEVKPTFVFAEAVGSCTDLVATVHRPMNSLHGERLEVLPITIVVDVACADEWLEVDRFPHPWEIGYLFAKQIEEADILLVNQADKVTDEAIDSALQKLRRLNPEAKLVPSSALTGQGLDRWLELALCGSLDTSRGGATVGGGRPLRQIDYDVYAAAEAQLGWLNGTFTWQGTDDFLIPFANTLQRRLAREQIEVAHAKLMIQHNVWTQKGALTSTHKSWVWSKPVRGQLASGTHPIVTVNVRALAKPVHLEEVFRNAVDEICEKCAGQAIIESLDCFAPGYPNPVHRMV